MKSSNLKEIAKKIDRKYERLFYFSGLFSGLSFSLLAGFIDRWAYGEHLSQGYIKFGLFTAGLSFISLYFLRVISRDRDFLKDFARQRIKYFKDNG